MSQNFVVEMLNITKRFPGVVANSEVTLQVKEGEIHALLGENGAGKSTLMSILFGLYEPDEGEIRIRGKKVHIANPNVANRLKIGMVHQHFKLVHNFSVTENIILGLEPTSTLGRIAIDEARVKVFDLSERYGLNVDPDAKIEDISVGMQQRVEILKMLYRDAEILIFDEPTAVLTPQETNDLIEIMREVVKEGKSIILITHKLREIKAVADRVTILRKGRGIGTFDVQTTSEEQLAEYMVGRKVQFKLDKPVLQTGRTILEIENLHVKNARGLPSVKGLNLTVRAGEIVGICGIEGNGQSELIEAITGLRKVEEGTIRLLGRDITNASVREITELGLGHIPEDRQKYGLVLDFTLYENIVLQSYYKKPFSKNGLLEFSAIRSHGDQLIQMYDVRSGRGGETITRLLSGGNQQKAIIAREVDRSPALLIAAQPTRGLDVGAIEFIHKQLLIERAKGRAILLVSLELDEILNMSDRIAVIYDGQIVGQVRPEDTNENELGLMMAGAHHKTGGEMP